MFSFAPVASDMAARVIISMYLYYHHVDKKPQCFLELLEGEVAFVNADLD
jgi:hypothetical protein